jgi:hypothetical protein
MSRKRARPAPKPSRPVPTAVVHGPRPAADVRRWIYGGLDVAFAALYAIAIATAARSRLAEGRLLLAMLPAFAAAAACGMFAGGAWGWRVASVGCAGLLAVATWILLAICIDGAYLAGVYGAFGKAAATFALISGLLVIELVALVPALQLKWLRSRAGRRAFGVPPRPAAQASPA